MSEENIQCYKILFLGDQYVGKSSILDRFYQDKFGQDYKSTIGLDFQSKEVQINNAKIRLLLYDTSGQEKFKSLIPMYVHDSNIIIIVYDITNKDSFIHVQNWIKETKELKREDVIFVLVGNKIDLEDKRAISKKETEEFAAGKGFLYHELSAKTGDEIKELFNSIILPEMAKKFNIELKKKLNDEIIKNNNLVKENIKLKEELNTNKLKIELDNITNENKKLKEDLLKANKIITNIGNNNRNNNNELKTIKDENMNLKYQLLQKENEIMNLKLKLLENSKDMDKKKFDMIVYFQSLDQVINLVPIRCSCSDTFAEVEEKLYKKYDDFRNTNNTPICKGKPILRFKTLSENNIKDEDVVQIIKIE